MARRERRGGSRRLAAPRRAAPRRLSVTALRVVASLHASAAAVGRVCMKDAVCCALNGARDGFAFCIACDVYEVSFDLVVTCLHRVNARFAFGTAATGAAIAASSLSCMVF